MSALQGFCAARRPAQAMPLASRASAPARTSQTLPTSVPHLVAARSGRSTALPRRKYSQSSPSVVGIDLGTTYSCVAVAEQNGVEPRVLENAEGQRTTPSVVSFQADGSVIVGAPAKRGALQNPRRTISAVKRLIGRRFADLTLQELRNFSFPIVEGPDGMAAIDLDGTGDKLLSPAEISSHVLRKMKETAELRLGKPVSQAVVTVPAYFSDAQRQATKKAAELAGMKIERIINEPTAAALAYGLKAEQDGHTVAVYDLGGGTFDISILEIDSGVFEVRSTNGDTYLGGEDFDAAIATHFAEEFKRQTGEDVLNNPGVMQRLREAAEKAKVELSTIMSTEVSVPFLLTTPTGGKHLALQLTRNKLDQLVAPLIARTLPPIKAALKDAELRPQDVDQVILVGGQSRMPKVVEVVRSLFTKEPYRGVNPDEAVAAGAAIQGAILKGSYSDLILLDVVPFSLGIRLEDGSFCHLISRNTAIPAVAKGTLLTSRDGQTVVELDVYQGEKRAAKDNKFLGHLEYRIPPAKKGMPIDIFFDVDSDGTLTVSAVDSRSSKKEIFGRLKPGSAAPAPAPASKRAPPPSSAAQASATTTTTTIEHTVAQGPFMSATTTLIEETTESVSVTTIEYEEVRGSLSMKLEQANAVNDKHASRLAAYTGKSNGAARWRCPVCGSETCKFYG